MTEKISANQVGIAYQVIQNINAASATSSPKKDSTQSDRLTLGTSPPVSTGIYTKLAGAIVDTETISRLKQEARKAGENLRALILELILNQQNAQSLTLNAHVVNQAKQPISEDGNWGVKAVSDRIVEFAKAISGDDKSKIDSAKTAIEKGFEEAGTVLNGKLPDISYQTHDEIMKKLDAWGNESSSESE